jgi:hypothetical protein
VWANAKDEPVAGLDLIRMAHDCRLYSLLVCCQHCAIAGVLYAVAVEISTRQEQIYRS